MDKSAILHIPMSKYAYGVDEDTITIRLRTAHGDIQKCILYYGDRSCRVTPVIFTTVEMERVIECERYDYFEATLEKVYKRLDYYFELNDGTETCLYYGDCFCKEPVDDRSEYFQFPFNHRADIVSPPDWAKDAVVYNIFPDSFATSARYISGQSTVSVVALKCLSNLLSSFAATFFVGEHKNHMALIESSINDCIKCWRKNV